MTLVLGHRGAPRQAPENTIEGFSRALALGADGVELDVRRTVDGALVVRHDPSGPVGVWAEAAWADVRRRLPAVPSLVEALDACSGKLVNVEIKNATVEPDWDPDRRTAALVCKCLTGRGLRDEVLVSSFDAGSLRRVRELAPGVPTALLTATGDPLAALAAAAADGHAAVHPSRRQVRGGKAREVTQAAHERGLRVNVWTVNRPDEVRRLVAAGVDGLVSDVPDVVLSALGPRP